MWTVLGAEAEVGHKTFAVRGSGQDAALEGTPVATCGEQGCDWVSPECWGCHP